MQYFTIITLSLGDRLLTADAVLTVDPPATRQAIYRSIRDLLAAQNGPQWRKATVVFFSTEPDGLGS